MLSILTGGTLSLLKRLHFWVFKELVACRGNCCCSDLPPPYIPISSVAHPGHWILVDGEPDPAELMGLIPSERLCDLNEDKVLASKIDTLGGALTREDADALVSALTSPYLRIPLLLQFFSQEKALSALLTERVQRVLEAALFEPLSHGNGAAVSGEWQVPIPAEDRRALLGTPFGLLLNELHANAAAVVDPFLTMFRTVGVLTGADIKSGFRSLHLFLCRLAVRLTEFVKAAANTASPDRSSLPACLDKLQSALVSVRAQLLAAADAANAADLTDQACEYHCHAAITFLSQTELGIEDAALLMSSTAFLTNWYTPRHGAGCLDVNEVVVCTLLVLSTLYQCVHSCFCARTGDF